MSNISYSGLIARAKQDAKEAMPDLPKVNTYEAWQTFLESIEAIESGEVAHESADSWDWVIYHGQALELCAMLPSSLVSDAESMASECGGIQEAFESGGLGGVACLIAYWIIYQAVQDEVELAKEELLELAQSQIDNLESL
jgi:hypothetical protein